MRIIGGSAKGRILKMPGGGKTRPAMSRVRGSYFNIIAPRIEESRFLDLFAGSGSVGIEALSRGAAFAVFVDKSPLCTRTIRENLEMTRFLEQSQVFQEDCVGFLKRYTADPFDFVAIDPPYLKGLLDPVLELIPDCSLFHEKTLFMIERQKKDDLHFEKRSRLILTDERNFGDTVLTFFRKRIVEAPPPETPPTA
ncbi:MAG TPA: 16S rRNA (guanine(966)-N(2))-methyltransferase RsmD [Candidatus Ozemobacteraceae bacterium]|nr:16S rRNA (guanine(966)-N(2))-methyltransferase RsmD [Candidatus Ozemobacteraceae bacterium]